jgi:phenylpyruvate tautomerase PptA (4-oxalocrotonate tautomerase family)
MPYIKIETNKKLTSGDFSEKMKRVSEFISQLLDKPEKWVMVAITTNIAMLYAGIKHPTAFVELKSIGLEKDRCPEYSKAICDFLAVQFEIPAERVYIEFVDIDRKMFGWNSGTF